MDCATNVTQDSICKTVFVYLVVGCVLNVIMLGLALSVDQMFQLLIQTEIANARLGISLTCKSQVVCLVISLVLTVIVVKIIDVPNATQDFIWISDVVINVAYFLTASAVQAVISAPNVILVSILTTEFAKLVKDCVLSASVKLFVQNVDLKTLN